MCHSFDNCIHALIILTTWEYTDKMQMYRQEIHAERSEYTRRNRKSGNIFKKLAVESTGKVVKTDEL
jgi:hypothetical protein